MMQKKPTSKRQKISIPRRTKRPTHQGVLTPLKKEVVPYHIVGFDTEDHLGTTVLYCFYDGKDTFTTRLFEDALAYMYNYPGPVIFVCHNLQYDLVNTFKACDYVFIDRLMFASRLIKATLTNVSGKTLYFLDSGSFFPGSLYEMGQILGIDKLEGSAFDEKYIEIDAKIVYTFMAKMQARMNMDGINMVATVGSMAMADFRTNYLYRNQGTHNTQLCLDAYFGGRVEVFYKGDYEGSIYDADINSCYPFVMRHREYPDTATIEPSRISTHRFGVGKFTVRIPNNTFIPPLPYHSAEGRLFFPVGDVQGTWTYAEVRYAASRGAIILDECIGEGTNVACTPFVDFVDTNYAARMKAEAAISLARDRAENIFKAAVKKLQLDAEAEDMNAGCCPFEDRLLLKTSRHRTMALLIYDLEKEKKKASRDYDAEFEKLFMKSKMNNLYGKFSQNRDMNEMTRQKKSVRECERLGAHVETVLGPFYQYVIKRAKPPVTANYMWGTYVTSYARLSLLERMNAVHDAGGTLLYCDTDSILFYGDKAKDVLEYSDTVLGAMKVKTYDFGNFVMAKGYYLCKAVEGGYQPVKLACKGVNQIYGLSYLHGHPVKYEKPVKLKEGLRTVYAKVNLDKDDAFRREHSENSWHEVTKAQKSVYFKRTGEHGVTLPINVADILALEAKDYSVEAKKSWEPVGVVIIPPEFKKPKFTRAVLEPGWEKEWFKKDHAGTEKEYTRRGMEFLSPQRCLDLSPGDSWFSGRVFGLERTESGKQVYIVGLMTFQGYLARESGIMVAVPAYYFDTRNFTGINYGYNFVGKNVEFILAEKYLAKYSDNKYIGNTPLVLRGKTWEVEPDTISNQETHPA